MYYFAQAEDADGAVAAGVFEDNSSTFTIPLESGRAWTVTAGIKKMPDGAVSPGF